MQTWLPTNERNNFVSILMSHNNHLADLYFGEWMSHSFKSAIFYYTVGIENETSSTYLIVELSIHLAAKRQRSILKSINILTGRFGRVKHQC